MNDMEHNLLENKINDLKDEIKEIKKFNSELLNILRNLYIQQLPGGYATLFVDKISLDVYMEELINKKKKRS